MVGAECFGCLSGPPGFTCWISFAEKDLTSWLSFVVSNFGFTCWILFCSGIQFNLLLSPYPCFISLLYLDLYVLGEGALIS